MVGCGVTLVGRMVGRSTAPAVGLNVRRSLLGVCVGAIVALGVGGGLVGV